MDGAGQQTDPTPDEIRQRCRRIQSTWSDLEREKRLVTPRERWTVPVVEYIEHAGHGQDEAGNNHV